MKREFFSILFVSVVCFLFAQHALAEVDLVKELDDWSASADELGSTAKLTQNDVVKADFMQIPQPNDSTWPWVSLEAVVKPNLAADLEGLKSIEVTYKCGVEMLVLLPMPELVGGTSHRAVVPSASGWETEELGVGDFKQPEWVVDQTDLDLSKVICVEFIPNIDITTGGEVTIELQEVIVDGITTPIVNDMVKTVSNGLSIGRITADLINISVPVNGLYTLSHYSVNGKMQKAINSKLFSKGNHEISWSARGVSTGIYFIQLSSGGNKVVKKIFLK